jgi:23S rRNA pseudouridine1911/1915/1917 synthase
MKENLLFYLVDPQDRLVWLRDVFKKKLPVSRALLARLKVQEKIRVNGQCVHTNYRLQPGDLVTVDLNLNETNKIAPQDIPIDIIYQDDDIMVINKPAVWPFIPLRENWRALSPMPSPITGGSAANHVYFVPSIGWTRIPRSGTGS